MISDGRAAPVPPLLSTPRLPSGRRGRAAGVRILREAAPERRRFLDGDALDLLARLTRRFGPDRDRLLRERGVSRAHARPWTDAEPLPEIHAIRSSEWSVDSAPAVLADRRIEVVGGVRRESIVRGLNSRADVYVADFEDRHSPTWEGTLQAHLDLTDAVHRALELESSAGQRFRIVSRPATLMIRPRGLHQVEGHVTIDGRAVPASFFDFALYVSHAARELQRQGLGPYFRLGGLEHASEARLWADLFAYTEFELGMSPGTIRGCVSVDTVSAAWELDEILHALRRHSAGVAAHRWAYLFSFVKQFRGDESGVLPGRSALTLAAPIVATYYRRIAFVARRRGAVAVADVELEPSGPTEAKEANAPAALPSELAEVRQLGFDAIGLTAPGLVLRVADGIEGQPMALAWALPPEFRDPAASLRASRPTRVPEEEVRGNVRRTLAYFAAWYRGTGDAGIDGRRDDGASVEFARAQVWQWMHREIPTDGGRTVNPHLLRQMVQEEVDRLMGASDAARSAERAIVQSARLLDELVTEDDPVEYFPLRAYNDLERSALDPEGRSPIEGAA